MKEPKRRHWWMYILIFLASQLAAAAIPVVLQLAHGGLSQETLLVCTLLAANLLGIILFFLYRPAGIGCHCTPSRFPWKRMVLSFLFALPVILLVNIIQEAFFPEIPDIVGDETFKAIMHNPLGLMTVALLGPCCEELLFRAGVQGSLQEHSRHFIFFSALIFSLIHLNPAQMPAAFVLGLVLGFAYWWSGSLLAPVCIHVFNNTFACVLSYLSPDDDSLIHFLGGEVHAWVVAGVSALFLCFIGWLIRQNQAGK